MRLRPPALQLRRTTVDYPGLRICAWPSMRLRPPALQLRRTTVDYPGLRICAWPSVLERLARRQRTDRLADRRAVLLEPFLLGVRGSALVTVGIARAFTEAFVREVPQLL